MKLILDDGTFIECNDVKEVTKDNWYSLLDENYVPDKDKFIIDKFITSFPDINFTGDIKQLYNVIGRSEFLKEWLASINTEFLLSVQCPEYFKDLISDREFDAATKISTELNKKLIEEREEKLALNVKYKDDYKNIVEKYKKLTSHFYKNQLVRIMSITSEQLPISIQLQIENFTPSQESDENAKVKYAKECLIRYKQLLIRASNDGHDIEKLIMDNRPK